MPRTMHSTLRVNIGISAQLPERKAGEYEYSDKRSVKHAVSNARSDSAYFIGITTVLKDLECSTVSKDGCVYGFLP